MTPQATPLGKTFAARVSGIDLRQVPDAATHAWIEDTLARFGVLSFGPQRIDDTHQERLIQLFGPPFEANFKEIATGHRHFYDITTVDEDGATIATDSPRGLTLLANAQWHTDGSQLQPPTRVSVLHARVLPPVPPPTEYADMRAAWEALPAYKQAEVEKLSVVHSIAWSREQIGFTDINPESLKLRPPVVHPLVRTNPVTGRKSLYLASHASHPVGWPVAEGRAYIHELVAHATQLQFVYSHAWSPDELVMWDDRWTMHRATPYDAPHPRILRWCGAVELEPV
jgi:alpha-ketoglutarate-dependent 2,4-dichlorophenoxyacetate dioxygenase